MDRFYTGLWRFRIRLSLPAHKGLVFFQCDLLDVFVEPVKFLFHQHVADYFLRHGLVLVGSLEQALVAADGAV